ncbi:MAG: hypothetical protein MJ252_01170 [archaeon]|nr:hypothetical protein [archaeon]
MHPELISSSLEIKNRRYQHYDSKRKEKIQRAIQARERLLNKCNSTGNIHNDKGNTLFNQGVSSAEMRDQEQFENMKKQNLCEIKNLIDFEISTAKTRNINEAKLKMQQEKDEMITQKKNEEKNMRNNMIRQKEIQKEENDKKERLKQIKQYRQYFKEQQLKRKEEEKKEKELQKKLFEKQLENQKKEEEFRNKLEENYQERLHKLELKQQEIDMKSDERQKKIDLNREKVAQKYLQQSKLREVKISNAKEKKLQNLQKKVDKYNQKQEAIIQLKEDQKKEREKEQFEIRAKQEEKEKKTSETRERYERILAERRLRLLQRFDKTDKRIQTQKEKNQRIIMDKNYSNSVRRLDAGESVKEKEMQMDFHNSLKLQEIIERQKRAEDLQKKRYLLSCKKIKMKDEMKEKKESLINKVHEIMSKGKVQEKDDIYRQIFSREDLRILGKSQSTSHIGTLNEGNSSHYKSDGFKNKSQSIQD